MDIDESRGILSETDRNWLWMDPEEREEEYSRSASSQRRKTIRYRLYNGLRDLRILNEHLPDSERQQVFQDLEEGFIMDPRGPIARDATAFILRGVIEQENVDFDDEEFYESVFRDVIEQILFKHGLGAENITVDVEIKGWTPPGDLSEADPADLSEDTLRRLLFEGQITNKEFAEGILAQSDE